MTTTKRAVLASLAIIATPAVPGLAVVQGVQQAAAEGEEAPEGQRGSIDGRGVPAAGSAAEGQRGSIDAARIDWAAGRITAGGTGIADRHAPSPAIALGTSRRGAEEAARRRIAAKLGALPLAAGGTLATKLADPAIQARVDAAVASAITIAAEPETDGSWHVTLAVPLEAIRIAIGQPRALPAAGDRGPLVVVVERASAKPALDWTIGGAAVATLWVKTVPAWAKDAPRMAAGAVRAGAIALVAPSSPSALYVVITN